MSARLNKKLQPLAVETVSRQPQQGRSRASLERMLGAARELMLESGSEEFTLLEVSQRGNVSIGSIHLRFESKDNLVRAVIANTLQEIAGAESKMLEQLLASSESLADFVPRYFDAYAEVLRKNAPLLRLSMQRASQDALVSGPGKERTLKSAREGAEAMLRFAEEIGGKSREIEASSAYHVIFATLARVELGLDRRICAELRLATSES